MMGKFRNQSKYNELILIHIDAAIIDKVFFCFITDNLSQSAGATLANLPRTNEQRQNITMWPETQVLLRELYAPANKALADMLHDEGYLWDEQHQ